MPCWTIGKRAIPALSCWRANAYAETIAEAILNLIAVFYDPDLFDPNLDFAVRAWGQGTDAVKARVTAADAARLGAIRAMFERFGFAAAEADVRARTVYLTQIGYISMQVREDMATRLSRVPDYVRAFFRHIRHGNRTCALSCPVEICTCRIGLWAALGTRTCGLCGTRQRRGHTRRQSQSAWGVRRHLPI